MRILDESQVARILAAIPLRSPFGARDHAMIRLAVSTGLRVAELVGLDIGMVWTRSGEPRQLLDLPASIAKGRRSRVIPLCGRARQAVIDLVTFLQARGFSTAPSSPLLCDRRHRRLPVREVQRLLQSLRDSTDLDVRATPHTLRHLCATQAAGRAPVHTVRALLGHRDLKSTQIYLHSSVDDLRRAIGS